MTQEERLSRTNPYYTSTGWCVRNSRTSPRAASVLAMDAPATAEPTSFLTGKLAPVSMDADWNTGKVGNAKRPVHGLPPPVNAVGLSILQDGRWPVNRVQIPAYKSDRVSGTLRRPLSILASSVWLTLMLPDSNPCAVRHFTDSFDSFNAVCF